MLFRRRDVLDYMLPPKLPGQALTDFMEKMATGGCSTKTWEQRCEASMRASRRRRGLRPEPQTQALAKWPDRGKPCKSETPS